MSAVTPPRASLRETRFFNGLSEDDQERLAGCCETRSYAFGAVIVREGEEGDALYVIQAGRARVVQANDDGSEIMLTNLHPGDVFGEISLLKDAPRAATVRASRPTEVLRLDRDNFTKLVRERPHIGKLLEDHASNRLLFNIIKKARSLDHLPEAVIHDVIAALKRREYSPGQRIIVEGEPPGPMYIVEQGKLRITARQANGQVKNLDFLREGDIFGEASVLNGDPRSATVIAVAPCCLFSLDYDNLQRLFTRWPQFRRAMEERVASFDYKHEAQVPLDFSEELLPARARSRPGIADDGAISTRSDTSPQTTLPTSPSTVSTPAKPPKPRRRIGKPRQLFGKRNIIWRRFPFIHQVDEADCGVACLGMICRYYGRRVSLPRIRMLAHTDTDGTSLNNLCEAARRLGLASRAVKVSLRNLPQLPTPAILHWRGNHWVILLELRKDKALIADPANSVHWVTRAELEKDWNGYTALFDYTEKFEQAPESRSSFSWFWPFLRPQMPLLYRVLLLTVISTSLTFIAPVLTQVIVDRVVVEGAYDTLFVVLIAMGVVFTFQSLGSLLQGYLMAFAAMHIDAAAFDSLTRKLLALPTTYFQARRTGDIQRRLDGARQVRQMLITNSLSAGVALVQLFVALVLMALYSSFLLMIYLSVVPFYAGMLYLSARYLRPLYDKLEEQYGEYRSDQLDSIKGIESVKTSAAESTFREKLLGQFMQTAQRQFKADYSLLAYQGATNALGMFTMLLFLWLGAQMAIDGELTLGGFVAFFTLVGLANAPISILLSFWERFQFSYVLLNRLDDIFEYEPEQGRDHTRLLPVHTLSGSVELRGASFRYGGTDSTYIIRNLSLKVPAGKTVAIVGRSGSGKTTLVKLLTGLMDLTEGAIMFDSVDLRTLNYKDLRQRIGYVLQESHVFSGTVLENIAFGSEPDLSRAITAARAASAHEFVERLPSGYETKIGETGIKLSGGQNQRITIARAIYRNPSILILDEATSALDAETEREVQEKMDVVFAGRTVFVIAHRLSTIRNADHIIVLEKGEIAEQGSHEELMDRRGIYFYLVSRQIET